MAPGDGGGSTGGSDDAGLDGAAADAGAGGADAPPLTAGPDGASADRPANPRADGGPADALPPPAGDAAPPVIRDAALPDLAPPDTAPPRRICRAPEDCPAGENCAAGFCEPAPATCAEVKTHDPAAGNGVYWLRGARTERVYCNMQMKPPAALCAETAGVHDGTTREGSNLHFRLSSQLELAQGTCRIWGVHHPEDGWPLDQLNDTPTVNLSTCRALGFTDDDSGIARMCKYGGNPGYTHCGFAGSGFYKWANWCMGCAMNDGQHPTYVLQGYVYVSTIPWNTDGSISSRCHVR
jgi:hypothetical protein